MTTQETIESTYQPNEISKMLAEIVEELDVSPPCDVTNEYFKMCIVSLIRHNRLNSITLKTYQDALSGVLRL